ncbi:uncharacterized protein LOC127442699 [Myxocyprinus asiaticus]|uniref:uncharacterized protein LOC127442699 n=1 Tax=Myxocyprinus asiaticus TaxID=70543 RepID=UPI002223693F|nr:uncharacterized protein LOC127442699 [Myxocyprinus asiaticus]
MYKTISQEQTYKKELRKRWDSLRTQYICYKKLAPSGRSGVQKTGRQQWILTRLQFLEPCTKRKEPSADSDSYSPSDGNNIDTWTSTHEEPSFFEAEPWPNTPLAESTICGAESTVLREEPLPSTFIQSTTPRPQGKCSRKMLDESSSEESTNLMRPIGKTLEKLASQENTNDAISAYCKNLEHRMRKLHPHLLPHFQHEVDNCIFKYSVGQNHALEASDGQFTHL